MAKKIYEVGSDYFLKMDKMAERPIDRVTFWSRNWCRSGMTGEVVARVCTKNGKASAVSVRFTGHGPVSLARVVLIWAKGLLPNENDEPHHLDGDPTNNYPTNLRWRSRTESNREKANVRWQREKMGKEQ